MEATTVRTELKAAGSRARTRCDQLLQQLESSRTADGQLDAHRTLAILRELLETVELPTLEILLPLLLQLDGKPYTLVDHFPFSPMFYVNMAQKILYKTGRQVAKTTSEASSSILRANTIPNFTQLFVSPLFEQIRRFSNLRVKPLIDCSPIKALWVNTSTEKSVLQRSFRNMSKLLFSFALLDADRTRGFSCDSLGIDELQDMDPEHIKIIAETMSHSQWRLMQLTGTPKTFDNAVEGQWGLSSQAEWWIPCTHCTTNGYATKNIPALDYHLLAMIGPVRDDISDERPGVICHQCRQPINPRFGRWNHRFEDRRWDFAGYHVPQILLPLHYNTPKRWAELVAKVTGGGRSPATVYNEVLGESYDVGTKLISLSELMLATTLPWKNNPRNPDPRILERLPSYVMRVLAIDWGGGGEAGVSFTSMALLGLHTNGRIDVLWGRRLLTPNDHLREAKQCRDYISLFKPDIIAHDYTGAGTLRETCLVQAGVPVNRLMPVAYVRAASSNVVNYIPASIAHPRDHYRVDKTRTLLYTSAAIKKNYVRFFQDDYRDSEDPGLLRDFLNLVEEKTESRMSTDLYIIKRGKGGPDDFAQAVNIGCVAIWHTQKKWPDFMNTNPLRLTPAQLEAGQGTGAYPWDTDGFFATPGRD